MTQNEVMADLNAELFPARGVRVRTSDIPGFPARTITAELYDIEESATIDKEYETLAHELEQLRQRGLSDLSPDAPVTKILRAREKIELLKVPLVVELVKDALAKHQSVAVFVNFASVLRELRHALQCNVYIDGTQSPKVRAASIKAFQENSAFVILCNSKAGGVSVSLHDLHGTRQRLGLVMPCHSAVDTRQVFGRLPREGGKSAAIYRLILAAGTVEMTIRRQLAGKLDNLDALTDADLMPENLRLAA